MDPSSTLDSLFLPYETSTMTTNDVRQENHSPHLTQNYDTSQQPPGAEVARHTTFTFPGQAAPSLQHSLPQGHVNLEDDARRMLTQIPVSFQGHEQEARLYPPSPPSSDSSPSNVSHLRASHLGHWDPPFPIPDTSGNIYPHPIPTHHSRSFSHPMPMSTRPSPRGSAFAGAGVDARVPQAGYSGIPSAVMQPSHQPSPELHTTLYGLPSPSLHGTPDLAHIEFPRRYSEADVLCPQGALSPPFTTPNHQSALAACPPHSERPIFSLAPSTPQGLCASLTETVKGPSSGSDGSYLPDQSPTPSGSQDCSMSVVSFTPSPEPFSIPDPDATDSPSQNVSHLPHNGLSSSSPWLSSSRPLGNGDNSGAARNPQRGRASKKHREAMDPRAAKRLEKQRRTDEENIKILWDLFVPKDDAPGLKKDRLGAIVHHAKLWMRTYKSTLPYATSLEHRDRAEEGSATQAEGGVSQRQGQLARSGDFSMGFARYVNAGELSVDDTAGSTTSGLQKQTILLTHRPN